VSSATLTRDDVLVWRVSTARVRQAIGAVLILAIVVGGAAFKWPEFFLQMGEDQGIFTYGGLLQLQGGLLYRDFWETKPPLEYLVHGVVVLPIDKPWDKLFLGEAYTTPGQLALNFVDLVWSFATAAAVYAVARRWLMHEFALVAALLAILNTNAVMLSQEGSIAEKHLLLPITLAVLCFQKYESSRGAHWLVAAGSLVAVGVLFKQPAAMTGAALGATALAVRMHAGEAVRERGARAVLLLAGFLMPILVLGLWLLANNLVSDFWQQVIVFNLTQAATHPGDVVEDLVFRTKRVVSEASGLLWLLAGVGSVLLLRLRRGVPRPTLWLVWALASLGAILWGGGKLSQPYYLYVVPSFALLGGYAVQRIWLAASTRPIVGRTLIWSGLVVSCAILFVFGSLFQRRVTLRILHERWPVTRMTSDVERLGFRLPKGGTMYIWGGETQLYLFSGATPPTRHTHMFFLSYAHSTDPSYLDRRAELMADLRRAPPDIILVDPRTRRVDPDGSMKLNLTSFPELQQFLAEQYGPYESMDEFHTYHRRLAGAGNGAF